MTPAYIVHSFKTREQWLEFRRLKIGGSDAPVIMGLVNWQSPYGLMVEKRGLVPQRDTTDEMSLGAFIEPWVRDRLHAETGWTITFTNLQVHQNLLNPWCSATLDGVIENDVNDGPGVLEIKMWSYLTKEDLENPESEPRRVFDTQLQHNLVATGWKWGVVAIVVAGRFRWYEVARDNKRITEITAAEQTFHAMLMSGEFPEVDGSEATERAIRKMNLRENRKPISLSMESVLDFEEWDLESQKAKEALAKAAVRKNRLLKAIGPHSFAVLPNGVKLSLHDVHGSRVLRRMK